MYNLYFNEFLKLTSSRFQLESKGVFKHAECVIHHCGHKLCIYDVAVKEEFAFAVNTTAEAALTLHAEKVCKAKVNIEISCLEKPRC